MPLETKNSIREGGQGGGDMGIRGAGDGGKGGRGGGWGKRGWGIGEEGAGMGEEGAGVRKFWGGCYTKICCVLLILLYFYVLQCTNWVSEVSNRRTEVNSGILTMNPALISLHRQGVVFR